MLRLGIGVLAVLLAVPALHAAATPAEQYKALAKEYEAALEAFQKAYDGAKTEEERRKIVEEKYPDAAKYAAKFLDLAEKNPKDAAAADALLWIVVHRDEFQDKKDSPLPKALTLLRRDHLQSDRIGPVCEMLAESLARENESALRAILEKNPSRDVQGAACMSLASYLQNLAEAARDLKDHPEKRPDYKKELGEDTFKDLMARDPAQLDKEIEQLFDRVVKDYAKVENGALAKEAEKQLFEIRHLGVGKEAPEVEGEDQDGKKFKLSDYRGKVVLLDFWGNW